ncbi:MAG: DUF2461 domain-containing protein [Oscillospiraceae bacterium]|nr:DUF2461 domain-containing protein [Oscillospiraceae bacterium]
MQLKIWKKLSFAHGVNMEFKRMLEYSGALAANNERAWFHENHKQYEQARGDFISLLDRLRFAIAGEAPAIAYDIMYMQAKDWMYRIARDMRYSRNRPPYDPAFRAYISADRKSWLPIGYFIRVFPGGSVFGTGIWFENTANINRVRDYISEHLGEFEDIVISGGLKVDGERLKRMPKGYSEDDPAAGWLKFKNWFVLENIPDSRLTDFDSFCAYTAALVKRMEPLRLFLLDAARHEPTQKQLLEDFHRFDVE